VRLCRGRRLSFDQSIPPTFSNSILLTITLCIFKPLLHELAVGVSYIFSNLYFKMWKTKKTLFSFSKSLFQSDVSFSCFFAFPLFLQYKFDWKWVLCRFVELCKINSSVFNFSWTQLKFCFRPLFLLITNDRFSPQQNTTFHLRFIFHWLTLHSNSFVSAQSFESFLFFWNFCFYLQVVFSEAECNSLHSLDKFVCLKEQQCKCLFVCLRTFWINFH
jgi:hypothetical protein